MSDFLNDPIGSQYGCSYKYTTGTLGTFGALLNDPVIPRKVKDPVPLDGADFMTVNAPFEPVIKIGSYIQMVTKYTYPTNKYVLGGGIEEITKDQIDFSKFKKVISFSSLGSFTITAIPKDQLIVSKNLVSTKDYPEGIGYIGITATNVNVHVALTKDNKNWVKYNPETSAWEPVDLTADTDTLKSTMMPLATLTSLTEVEYSKYFKSMDYVGIGMVLSIEPTSVDAETGEETYDANKSYMVTPIEINYVGTDNPTTDPLTQYFNFIKVGYNTYGDPILIADRVIQTNISFTALNNANYDLYNGRTKAPMSIDSRPMYMRLLNGGPEDEDEYTKLILNASQEVLKGKSVDAVFNINLGSMTNVVATVADDEGVAPGNTVIVYRGGESLATRKKNMAFNAANSSYGWRPVIEIDYHSKEATKTYPGPALPEVHALGQLTKGKCISCDFIPKWRESSHDFDIDSAFTNLGNAKLSPISDYKNNKPGSFYFICVGYTYNGERILIADRNLITGFNGIGNMIRATDDASKDSDIVGHNINISGVTGEFYLDLVSSSNDPNEVEWDKGMWNNVITNEYDRTKTIDQIWHTDKISSVTASISSEKENYMILRGGEDMSKHIIRQKSVAFSQQSYSDNKYDEIGYRPMIIVPNEYRVEGLHLNFKTGYKVNKDQDTFELTCKVFDPNNIEIPFKLIELNSLDGTPTGVELSPYGTSNTRTIHASKFTINNDKYVADNYIGIVIKKGNTDTLLMKVAKILEKDYRLNSSRSFDTIYGGWKTVGTTAEQIKLDPISDSIKPVIRNEKGTYVEVSSITNKIRF